MAKAAIFGCFAKGLLRQNGKKWPILELNFKHSEYISINGLNIIYRLQNLIRFVLCKTRSEKGKISKGGKKKAPRCYLREIQLCFAFSLL